MANIRIDELSAEVMRGLQEYATLSADAMKKSVKASASTVVKEIKKNAPVRTGAYAKSWTSKKTLENSYKLEMVVYSKNRYQIAHLLENGYAKRSGGRVSGRPHIAPAERKGEEQLIQDIHNALNH